MLTIYFMKQGKVLIYLKLPSSVVFIFYFFIFIIESLKTG